MMEQQDFVVSDVNFQSINEENTDAGTIKTEDVKDEDMLLFSQAELQQLSDVAVSNGFQIIPDLDINSNQASTSFTLQQPFGDVTQLTNNIQCENFINSLPIDITGLCKSDGIKSDAGISHFIKYKLLEGKHTKIWECGICGKEFGHQYTLMRHLPTHTDERKFQCTTCGKAFRQMSTLSQHRAIHSSERPYVCEICQKTFNRVSTLISHRKTHTGLKPHCCHLCNKAFHQKGNLRNHIFTHTNERPYKCDVCEKGFNQMSNLMCHKVKAHQRTDKPKYICQLCGKDFPKRMALRNHEQYQHGVNNQPSEPNVLIDNLKLSNAIIVEPIKTEAMRLALETDQIPFALLRPLTGIPVLVRVLPAGDKQMLVPATADDLKKYGQISITPKEENTVVAANDQKTLMPGDKPAGSTVQIRIPVVATVIQQSSHGGIFSMSVVSPGPNGAEIDGMGNTANNDGENYVFSSTLLDNELLKSDNVSEVKELIKNNTSNSDPMIEFIDEEGNVVSENEFKENMSPLQENELTSTVIEVEDDGIEKSFQTVSETSTSDLHLNQNMDTTMASQDNVEF